MRKKVHIHFVCTGNTFRSRLAEAYLTSKQISTIRVSSSGIAADRNEDGPITWYAARLALRNGLVPYLKHRWTKTGRKHLATADLVIFMDKKHIEQAKRSLGYNAKQYEIWNIPDTSNIGFATEPKNARGVLRQISASERVFEAIREKIEALISSGRF